MPPSHRRPKHPRLTRAQRDHFRLLLADAKERLASISEAIDEVCGSDAWRLSVKTLGVDIGNAVRDKWDGVGLRAKPVPGDDGFLLEATHQVMGRCLQDRDNPSLGQSCKLIVDTLTALGDIDEARRSLGLPSRIEAQFHQYIEKAVTPLRAYVFLFYTTHLRIQLPPTAPELEKLDHLLDRYRLFSILARFPTGITDVYVAFNGRHRFEEPGGVPFENRYHYDRAIGPGETLASLVQLYPNWDRTFENRLQSLRQYTPSLAGVDVDAVLLALDPPVTRVRMVPPHPFGPTSDYEARITQFRKALDAEAAAKDPAGSRTTRPGRRGLSGEYRIDRVHSVFRWKGKHHRVRGKQVLELLACLLKRAPNLVSREVLLKEAWSGRSVQNGNIRSLGSHLRRFLKHEEITDLHVFGENKGLGIKLSAAEA